LRSFPGRHGGMALSPDGRWVVGSHSVNGTLLRIDTENLQAESFGSAPAPGAVAAWSPDGRCVAVALSPTRGRYPPDARSVPRLPGEIWLLDAVSGRRLWKANTGDLATTVLAFDPSGRELVSVHFGLVSVWDAETGKRRACYSD